MNIPRHIFKTYDIRGLIGEEVTVPLAARVGRGFVTLIQNEHPGIALKIAVGRDMRESSAELQEALMSAMIEAGADVLDVGLVSTPAFYFSVGHTRAHAGVMISASHNPAAYNGFKLTRANAVPVSEYSGIQEVADIIESESFAVPSRVGTRTVVSNVPSLAAEHELAFVGNDPVRKMRVVADPGNGMGAQYLDELFKRVPLDVTRMYWEFDGNFPNHEADPLKEENTRDLRRQVLAHGADIGIATDGDGDRIFFVDDKGDVVEPSIVRGLIAQVMLRRHPGARVCYDIRPGKITEDMIREAGGEPCITRVGHSLIKEQMIREEAIFAGESSGHFFYAFPNGCYEGPVAVASMMLQEMTRLGKSLSDIVAPLRRYAHSGEINFQVSDKAGVLAAIKQAFSEGTLLEIDGVTITYPDFWFNVRASNTESLIRLTVEAIDRAAMESRRDEITAIIKQFV